MLEQTARQVGLDRLNQAAVGARREIFLNCLIAGRHMGTASGRRFLGAKKIEDRPESLFFCPATAIEGCQLNGPVLLGKRHGAVGGAEIEPYATVQLFSFLL